MNWAQVMVTVLINLFVFGMVIVVFWAGVCVEANHVERSVKEGKPYYLLGCGYVRLRAEELESR